MKPGLSLRVSQHLALTPQLQQSIRLLQLSTLELSQEIDQMLQDNPFLEQESAELSYEESLQLERAQRTEEALADERVQEDFDAINLIANVADSMPTNEPFSSQNTVSEASTLDAEGMRSSDSADAAEISATADTPDNWEGDGQQEMSADDPEWGSDASARNSSSPASGSDDDFDPAERNSHHLTLQEHLHRQALSLRLSAEDRAALTMLIESLNDDGYLEDDFETLAESLGATTLEDVEELIARFGIALKWLQSLEPVGVGARSLVECLLIQLRELETQKAEDEDLLVAARAVLMQPLDLLAKRDVKRLAQLCKASLEDIKAAMSLIARLEPKPARAFAQVERNVIVPDVIVRPEKRRGQTVFVAQLNPDVMPKLHVNDLYAQALKRSQKTEAVQNLQGRLQEARWFIKNVQQRFDTIQRVSQAIVERQSSFFKHGAVAMRPLVLREIADEIGMHESTISRVTTAKYMATPFGTYELKYFFGSALTTETGGIASSTAVRELIKQFIDAENKAKPLSDSAIADMLKEQGIECARRTVAKYREALRIPVTSLRKAL
jgi:RNA polymerase sigma-54 factor